MQPETLVELVVLCPLIVTMELTKDQARSKIKADWCVNYDLQSNQCVGGHVEEKKKKMMMMKKKKEKEKKKQRNLRFDRFLYSIYSDVF